MSHQPIEPHASARKQRRGRPRDPEADQAILQTTLKLLTEHGYAGLSVERVASEAGVGKTTIYRRYNTKDKLVAAAVGALKDELGPPPDTGDTRADIVEMFVRSLGTRSIGMLERGPGFAMIGALLVEERRNPQLIELLRQRIMRPRRDDVITLLKRGIERGDIRADADLAVAAHAILGSILASHILGVAESAEMIEHTVDTIWRGIANDWHN